MNDRGAVADDFQMEHMLLQLQRPPEQEQALKQFIDQLHDPGSPNFHQWLTAQEFGERFGLAQEDLNAITTWLQSHGFQVNVVYPSGMVIDFSGSAGQVREAFQHRDSQPRSERREAHRQYERPADSRRARAGGGGRRLPARLHAPPDAQAAAQLHLHFRWLTYQAVVPADLATIYNLNPLFSAGTRARVRPSW